MAIIVIRPDSRLNNIGAIELCGSRPMMRCFYGAVATFDTGFIMLLVGLFLALNVPGCLYDGTTWRRHLGLPSHQLVDRCGADNAVSASATTDRRFADELRGGLWDRELTPGTEIHGFNSNLPPPQSPSRRQYRNCTAAHTVHARRGWPFARETAWSWEFFAQILRAYFKFLSTLDYKFLFN